MSIIERRPRQDYFEMGLRPGDRVEFVQLPSESAEIADERSILWRGEILSLTAVRHRLGREQERDIYSGRITASGRDLDELYDETYGSASLAASSRGVRSTGSGLTFEEVVTSADQMMGVKAVWGRSSEPVMCFGPRGAPKTDGYFSTAKAAATKAIRSPYLITIGGGDQVPNELRGRVLEVVRVTGVYGETSAFVKAEWLRQRLAQWPVAVALLEVYAIENEPDLVHDLGFPNRLILDNAFDTVKTNASDIAKLWDALRNRKITFRRDVATLEGFRDPQKVQLCGTLYPKLPGTSAEGDRVYKEVVAIERNRLLAKAAKELNRHQNGGHIVCEACLLSDEDSGMFDAHHLRPLSMGIRESNVEHFAVLCPTCHRWAHRKGPDRLQPLDIPQLRAIRMGQHDLSTEQRTSG